MDYRTTNKKNTYAEPKVSTEQKLALVQSLRTRQQFNRNQCREREQILYGQYRTKGELFASESAPVLLTTPLSSGRRSAVQTNSSFGSFRLRFLLAVCLFVLFFWADNTKTVFFQKDTVKLFQMIQQNLEIPDQIQAWNIIDL